MKTAVSKTKVEKKIRRSREDLRHEARLAKLLDEASAVHRRFDDIVKLVTSEKFQKMTQIDRHLYKIMASSLGTYYSALCMKAKLESVRLRTETGEFLNVDCRPFFDFALGEQVVLMKPKCDGKCKCGGKCKDK